jgi:hypothetical protein
MTGWLSESRQAQSSRNFCAKDPTEEVVGRREVAWSVVGSKVEAPPAGIGSARRKIFFIVTRDSLKNTHHITVTQPANNPFGCFCQTH